MDRLLLLSTCGTSLFTNGSSPEERAWLTKNANEAVIDDAARLAALVEDRRRRLEIADDATRRRMSAELSGIGAVLDKWKPRQTFHLLVHTDTALGREAAGLVRSCLPESSALTTVDDLRTSHLASFRMALADLTRELDALVQKYREQGWSVVFNLTGGFKSLNGYLQTVGMISADRCVFLFEGATELMEIPRLPVRLSERDELREHLSVFRRLAVGYTVTADEARHVPESLLMEDDGLVITSAFGDVVWARHRCSLLAAAILDPLSAKVRVADAVHKAFAGLSTDEKAQVNEALDEFSAYKDGVRPLMKSRTFKRLEGNPVPGSTHELYAWSHGSAGRLFGHESDGVFVFDRLTEHL